jgi:hypothetical protein
VFFFVLDPFEPDRVGELEMMPIVQSLMMMINAAMQHTSATTAAPSWI